MELANRISLSPRFVLCRINRIIKNAKNIKLLTTFIAASLLVGGFVTVTQSTKANHKICQCNPEKHCQCGSNCLCGSN